MKMAPKSQSDKITAQPSNGKPVKAAPAADPSKIEATCEGCGRKLKVRAELVGKKIKCPKCGKIMAIPAPPPPPPEPEEEIVMSEPDDDATYVEAEPDAPTTSILSKLAAVAGAVFIILTVAGCSAWANLSFMVT